MLLESGANADQADIDGWTPLRAAAWGGHTEVNPFVHFPNKFFNPAFFLIPKVVELLVEHGCQLDSVDAENRTALRAAAWSGHEEIVKILLQHGANVNLTDHEVRPYSMA